MENNQHFKKYESRLKLESFLKSLFLGLVVGLGANFVTALITWFTSVNQIWIMIAVLVAITAIATPIFYFKRFYPSVMNNARRLDRLGLEERLITMVEYENDDSYIAAAQREDAKAQLEKVETKSIRMNIPKKIWLTLIIVFVFASAMTTVSTLSIKGIIPGGDDLVDALIPKEPEIFVSVTYEVDEGGYIDGEADQLVLLGSDATPVTAIPEDGYAFVEWSDGHNKPYRTDLKVDAELELFAIFEPSTDGEGDGDGEGEGEGDGDSQQGQGQGEGEGDGDGEGEEEGNSDSNSGGGKYDDYNQIIDGKTYYREVLDQYKEKLAEYLEQNRDSLSEDEINMIEQYIGIV